IFLTLAPVRVSLLWQDPSISDSQLPHSTKLQLAVSKLQATKQPASEPSQPSTMSNRVHHQVLNSHLSGNHQSWKRQFKLVFIQAFYLRTTSPTSTNIHRSPRLRIVSPSGGFLQLLSLVCFQFWVHYQKSLFKENKLLNHFLSPVCDLHVGQIS
ncbi:hypothetical protein ATANTOWER_020388, partial [Ataeniobius toweri]|nr:hypothetical protein [Ataeniobius toweri]